MLAAYGGVQLATRNKLKDVSPRDLRELANRGGLEKAAAAFGVKQPSISRKLKGHFHPVIVWIAPNERVEIVEVAS